MFFFFQAEDGIRDGRVTGVQTCALPIFTGRTKHSQQDKMLRTALMRAEENTDAADIDALPTGKVVQVHSLFSEVRAGERSEERRVGKECRARGAPCRYIKKMMKREGSEV